MALKSQNKQLLMDLCLSAVSHFAQIRTTRKLSGLIFQKFLSPEKDYMPLETYKKESSFVSSMESNMKRWAIPKQSEQGRKIGRITD